MGEPLTPEEIMPHVPKPSDICSVCGRGLVHVIPSLDPPAPEPIAGLREALRGLCASCHHPFGWHTDEAGHPSGDMEPGCYCEASFAAALLDSDGPGLDVERLDKVLTRWRELDNGRGLLPTPVWFAAEYARLQETPDDER